MGDRYCIQCGFKIPDNAMFCPKCGIELSQNIDKISKANKYLDNKLWIIFGSVLVAILLGVLVFTAVNNLLLQNTVKNSKQIGDFELSSQAINGKDDDMGNLTENITAGGYISGGSGVTYIAKPDGIVSFNDKQSEYMQKGNFKSLNIYESNLYCIDLGANCICSFCDGYQEFYTFSSKDKLLNFGIYNGQIYALLKSGNNILLNQIDIHTKQMKNCFNSAASKAWMFLTNQQVRICLLSGSKWVIKESLIDDNNLQDFHDVLNGNNKIADMGFTKDKIVIVEENSSSVLVYDSNGNRNETLINSELVKGLLCSGNTIFVWTGKNNIYWFKEGIGFLHNLYEDLNINDNNIRTIGIDKTKLFVICSKSYAKGFNFATNKDFELNE